MAQWQIREFHADDLDQVVRVWEETRDTDAAPAHGLNEILHACPEGLSFVALVQETVVGVVVARAISDRAHVLMLGLAKSWRGQGLGSALLAELEKRLLARGLFHISALLPAGETGAKAYRNSGYETRDLAYFERTIPLQPQEAARLTDLGGRILPKGLWDQLAGMREEKEIIERRLVLPLAKPEVAENFGVRPPRAVVLFGPPGTGKTTFAKAVASRLAWPFVEVSPSRLAADPAGLASALRQTFHEIQDLEHAVVFIDEVEEIAAHRTGEASSRMQGVTNELLKIIPAFREQNGRILICATNFIRSLDKAFLRHGRFDYLIPIGLPDAEARRAIWRRYLPPVGVEAIDVDLLVDSSERFTPADIEFAARKASQRAFEAAVYSGTEDSAAVATDDYLIAIKETRATVTPAVLDDFSEDIAAIART
ncbi:ATP-binding protein [Sinomonas mesophila]|uniref:ATP-binding protein n=1 Tax=Sinomonas mesophila TaxID=1531955 RepID=UPI000987089E|nr:GNAT family N-acetyltransferase [Sinomonas mesophila]